jgi:hypothetical protein
MIQEDKNRIQGGIKGITEVFNEYSDSWPTKSIKKSLEKLRPEEGPEVYLRLKEGNYDLTEEALETERQFRPKVTIRTRELKTELNRWKIGGGAFFRVVGDDSTLEESQKLCLQYFIIWTRQLFPFQFGFLMLPFFITTLFLWQYSRVYIAGIDVELPIYLTLFILGLVFILLGTWVYFEGLIKRYIMGFENWKVIPDSMIGFVLPGVLFWVTALEYAITQILNRTGFPVLIPVSAWISLALGFVILGIGIDFYVRGEKSFAEKFSHPMDYAPLMIYLVRDELNDNRWKIDGAQFDYFHYKTMFISYEKLVFTPSDIRRQHPWFLIDRSWHAFREYIRPNILLRFFANPIIDVLVVLSAVSYYFLSILNRYEVVDWWILDYLGNQYWFLIIAYIVLPLLLVLVFWSRSRILESDLSHWNELYYKEKEELLKYHHLNYDRLRIFWNLRNREHIGEQRITNIWSKGQWIEGDASRLVARVKLQYPFDRYRKWHTIRDTQEELLSLIALQTKESELVKIQMQIEEAKRELSNISIEQLQGFPEDNLIGKDHEEDFS